MYWTVLVAGLGLPVPCAWFPQQGDPLGPLLFSMVTQQLTTLRTLTTYLGSRPYTDPWNKVADWTKRGARGTLAHDPSPDTVMADIKATCNLVRRSIDGLPEARVKDFEKLEEANDVGAMQLSSVVLSQPLA